MQLLPPKGALAVAAVVDIGLNTRGPRLRRPMQGATLAMRLAVPERHLEPTLQALTRHGIIKGIRGSRGGYELGREPRHITADEILRAAGTAPKMDRTPSAESALLNTARAGAS